MAKITPKENFMKMVRDGHPLYVPYYTMMGEPYLGEAANKFVEPNIFGQTHFFDGGYDMWGVKYVATEGTSAATMPDTRIILLEDIEDWRDVVKFPKAPEHIDWDQQYENDMKMFGVDREQSTLNVSPAFMPFQTMVGLMGFENCLIALYENPEECHAMLDAMVDFLEPYYTKWIDVYKPDIWYMLDDTCAKTAPFFSVETYRQVFKPIYTRLAKPANDRGIPIMFHNCGYCEPFIPEMIDFNVKIFEPMQDSNDIIKMRQRYPDRIWIGGADWGTLRPKHYPEYDEEELRQSIRNILDKYAPGGSYAFYAWPISYAGDPVIEEVNRIIRDEAHWYGRIIYGYTED